MRTYFIVAFALATAANGSQVASMMRLREARRLRVLMEFGHRAGDTEVLARFKQAKVSSAFLQEVGLVLAAGSVVAFAGSKVRKEPANGWIAAGPMLTYAVMTCVVL